MPGRHRCVHDARAQRMVAWAPMQAKAPRNVRTRAASSGCVPRKDVVFLRQRPPPQGVNDASGALVLRPGVYFAQLTVRLDSAAAANPAALPVC